MSESPITAQRIRECLISATLWARELPRYASRQQNKADWWSLSAGVIATITGLAIFPALDGEATDSNKFVVALFALAAGVARSASGALTVAYARAFACAPLPLALATVAVPTRYTEELLVPLRTM